MTQPRLILPGRTYLVTRRCSQRQFLLRPDEETRQIFEYCLAEAAARFEVETISWITMSDHYHGVVHDELGNLPDFLAHLHKMVAKVLNDRWERTENLWSSDACSVVHLVDDEDVFERVVYAHCNPSAQELVDRIDDWPGASSFELLGGRSTLVRRPTRFFRSNGTMPRDVTLRAAVPPAWRGREAEWRERVRLAIRKRERARRRMRLTPIQRAAARKRVSGVSPFARAKSRERPGRLKPSIACRDLLRRARAFEELDAFRRSYRASIQRFLRGDRAVIFPRGTYKHRQFRGPPSARTPAPRDDVPLPAWVTAS